MRKKQRRKLRHNWEKGRGIRRQRGPSSQGRGPRKPLCPWKKKNYGYTSHLTHGPKKKKPFGINDSHFKRDICPPKTSKNGNLRPSRGKKAWKDQKRTPDSASEPDKKGKSQASSRKRSNRPASLERTGDKKEASRVSWHNAKPVGQKGRKSKLG